MDCFIGEIRFFPYSFVPQDWLACNGQLLSLVQYQALASIIGQTFGGSGTGGSATIGLPNLIQRVAIGSGAGPGLTARTWGQQVGAATVTLNSTQLPAHTHTLNGTINLQATPTITAAPAAGSWFTYMNKPAAPADVSSSYISSNPTPNTTLAPASIASVGNGQAHDNNQPVLCLVPCIANDGVYPVRT